MSVGDIWFNRVNASTNNRAWGFGLWLLEQDPIAPVDDGGVVARALHAHLITQLLAIVSTGSNVESVESWRRFPGPARPGQVLLQDSPGLRTGDSMPNDNAIYVNLEQVAGDAKFNGGIFIAGQTDTDHIGSVWNDTYLVTQIKAFTDRMPVFVDAVGGDSGKWQIVVLSKGFVPASTPIGTPLDVVRSTATNRVMTQRRRRQKVVGFAPTTT